MLKLMQDRREQQNGVEPALHPDRPPALAADPKRGVLSPIERCERASGEADLGDRTAPPATGDAALARPVESGFCDPGFARARLRDAQLPRRPHHFVPVFAAVLAA